MFEKTPREIWVTILSNLEVKDLSNVALVNKKWNELSKDPTLWKLKCEELNLDIKEVVDFKDYYRKQTHSTLDKVYFLVGNKIKPYTKNDEENIWDSFPKEATHHMIFLNEDDAKKYLASRRKMIFGKVYESPAIFKVKLTPKKNFPLKKGGVIISKTISEKAFETFLFLKVPAENIQEVLSVNFEDKEIFRKNNHNKCSIM